MVKWDGGENYSQSIFCFMQRTSHVKYHFSSIVRVLHKAKHDL